MDEIPNIRLRDNHIEGTISLPVWCNFLSRQGAPGSYETQENVKGIFKISVGGDMVMDQPAITVDHINAYKYITNHSEQIQESILTRLLAEYQNLQTEYGYDEEDAKEMMPNVDSIEHFKNLIGLSQVHLMNVSKNEFAYVGYEFSCTWDDEHGLGFMTHKDKIIDFGGADTSFLTWVAKKDLESGSTEEKTAGNLSMLKAVWKWWQKLFGSV